MKFNKISAVSLIIVIALLMISSVSAFELGSVFLDDNTTDNTINNTNVVEFEAQNFSDIIIEVPKGITFNKTTKIMEDNITSHTYASKEPYNTSNGTPAILYIQIYSEPNLNISLDEFYNGYMKKENYTIIENDTANNKLIINCYDEGFALYHGIYNKDSQVILIMGNNLEDVNRSLSSIKS